MSVGNQSNHDIRLPRSASAWEFAEWALSQYLSLSASDKSAQIDAYDFNSLGTKKNHIFYNNILCEYWIIHWLKKKLMV